MTKIKIGEKKKKKPKAKREVVKTKGLKEKISDDVDDEDVVGDDDDDLEDDFDDEEDDLEDEDDFELVVILYFVLPTLCGGISATHFPASKKYLRFYDRKLKIYTVIATYI